MGSLVHQYNCEIVFANFKNTTFTEFVWEEDTPLLNYLLIQVYQVEAYFIGGLLRYK
jgi:hypothetical protein